MIQVPEGQASLAPRFSAGKNRGEALSPGGTAHVLGGAALQRCDQSSLFNKRL